MNTLSMRGEDLVKQKPVFLDVLADIWDPLTNPEGMVNIGLAENVRDQYHNLEKIEAIEILTMF